MFYRFSLFVISFLFMCTMFGQADAFMVPFKGRAAGKDHVHQHKTYVNVGTESAVKSKKIKRKKHSHRKRHWRNDHIKIEVPVLYHHRHHGRYHHSQYHGHHHGDYNEKVSKTKKRTPIEKKLFSIKRRKHYDALLFAYR